MQRQAGAHPRVGRRRARCRSTGPPCGPAGRRSARRPTGKYPRQAAPPWRMAISIFSASGRREEPPARGVEPAEQFVRHAVADDVEEAAVAAGPLDVAGHLAHRRTGPPDQRGHVDNRQLSDGGTSLHDDSAYEQAQGFSLRAGGGRAPPRRGRRGRGCARPTGPRTGLHGVGRPPAARPAARPWSTPTPRGAPVRPGTPRAGASAPRRSRQRSPTGSSTGSARPPIARVRSARDGQPTSRPANSGR